MTEYGDINIKGNIVQLQHFSVNDGEGIRTTIFMSGCPLRCRWCSNPESWTLTPPLAVFKNRCRGCGECRVICSEDNCTSCGKCVPVCPANARKIMGRVISAGEIKEEIARQVIFYRHSAGGITYSGGEPTLQAEFFKTMVKVSGARIYQAA